MKRLQMATRHAAFASRDRIREDALRRQHGNLFILLGNGRIALGQELLRGKDALCHLLSRGLRDVVAARLANGR